MAAYVLLAPALLVVVFVLLVPSVLSITNSFTSWNLLKPREKTFIWLNNYQAIFGDQTFLRSIRFTFIFILVTMTAELTLGTLAALAVVNLRAGWRKIVTTAIFIPYMLSPLAVGLTWKLMFAYDGLINGVISRLGLSPVTWMVNPGSASTAAAIAEIWRSYPFAFLLILATLTTMPAEPFQAARVDGASKAQTFIHVTLPMLRPTLAIVVIYQVVLKLRVFDLVYLLTGGGPVDYTTPLGLLIYRYYFRYFEAGLGSATAVFVLGCSVLISVVVIANTSRNE